MFAAADGLAKVVPASTEEAQYNLVWPVACALVRGGFGVQEALRAFADPDVAALFDRIEVVVDPELTAAFPQRRLTAVEIELAGGRRLHAGPLQAPGEPDDPEFPALVAAKVSEHVRPLVIGQTGTAVTGLRDRDATQLLALMCDPTRVTSVA